MVRVRSRVALSLLLTTRLAVAQSAAKAPDPAPTQPSSSAPAPASAPAPTSPTSSPNPDPASPPSPRSPAPGGPRLHHAPISVTPAHKPFTARASILHPELVKRALLLVRTSVNPTLREIEFRRGVAAPYIATVPQKEVLPTWLEYAIELEGLDGARTAAFASRQRLHRVHVPDDLADARERALLARLDGRRSVVFASGDYVNFGTSTAEQADSSGVVRTVNVPDNYFRIEAGYTYRPLRTVMEFSLRAGLVRSHAPVPLGSDPKPGMNYGAPTVRLRLHDLLQLEAELLTSVTDRGYSMGAGGAVLLGDPYGSKLTLGVEGVNKFGIRMFSRMDISASRFVTVAPMIEVTNMPHAEHFGVRLLGELDIAPGAGFGFALRGGYQARVFTAGGPSAGLTLRYAF
jgi:hypothetical protein